jgi:crotonobetaine/carnitine-CoA ligase
MNLKDFLTSAVSKTPQKIFLFFENQEISFQSFADRVGQLARSFISLGISKGDRVSVMLPNCPEYLYTWFGLNHLGAVVVPINPVYKEREVTYIVQHSQSRAMIVPQALTDLARKVKRETPSLKEIISLGEKPDADCLFFSDLWSSRPENLPETPLTDDDLAMIVYTSGTTGSPKGVMLAHRTYTRIGSAFARVLGLSPSSRLLTPLPLFHVHAQVYSACAVLSAGSSLILLAGFSPEKIWDQTRHYRATHLNLVGGLTPLIWSQPRKPKDQENPVEIFFSGWMTRAYFEQFEKRFALKIINGYGLTECPNVLATSAGPERKIGSIGLPLSHFDPSLPLEVKLVDDEGTKVQPGETGEIWVRSPAVMLGYWKDPESTAQALKDGWLHTGDKARRDEEGFYYFVDRTKDLIRRKGENISSREVESILLSHPRIAEVAVIGVPSKEIGDEEVKAYIVLKAGASVAPEEIFSWCEERLARFKVPRYLEFRKALPKTPSARVQKYLLKKEREDLTQGCFDRKQTQAQATARVNSSS